MFSFFRALEQGASGEGKCLLNYVPLRRTPIERAESNPQDGNSHGISVCSGGILKIPPELRAETEETLIKTENPREAGSSGRQKAACAPLRRAGRTCSSCFDRNQICCCCAPERHVLRIQPPSDKSSFLPPDNPASSCEAMPVAQGCFSSCTSQNNFVSPVS